MRNESENYHAATATVVADGGMAWVATSVSNRVLEANLFFDSISNSNALFGALERIAGSRDLIPAGTRIQDVDRYDT